MTSRWLGSFLVLVGLVVAAAWSLPASEASARFAGTFYAGDSPLSAAGYRLLIANLHNHTINTPEDHFLATGMPKEMKEARSYVNIFGVTDHAEQITPDMHHDLLALAQYYSDPAHDYFVLPGCEWTLGGLAPTNKGEASHVNIFYSSHIFGTGSKIAGWDGVAAPSLADLWRVLAAEAETNPGLIFQLNHPWANGHFRDMALPPAAYQPALVPRGTLVEVDSGLVNEMKPGIRWYERALQQGWEVGPTANNDGPGGIKVGRPDRRTGVWVDAKLYGLNPQAAIWEALKCRRVCALRALRRYQVLFGAEWLGRLEPMGSRLPADHDAAAHLYFSVACEAGKSIGRHVTLEIHEINRASVRVWRVDLSDCSGRGRAINAGVTTLPRPDTIAYFLVLRDGLFNTIVTAPIWLPRF